MDLFFFRLQLQAQNISLTVAIVLWPFESVSCAVLCSVSYYVLQAAGSLSFYFIRWVEKLTWGICQDAAWGREFYPTRPVSKLECL